MFPLPKIRNTSLHTATHYMTTHERSLYHTTYTPHSYILEMRGAPYSPHGKDIDEDALRAVLSEADDWLMTDEAYSADVSTINDKFDALKTKVEAMCKSYFDALEAERIATEQQLENEAKLRCVADSVWHLHRPLFRTTRGSRSVAHYTMPPHCLMHWCEFMNSGVFNTPLPQMNLFNAL